MITTEAKFIVNITTFRKKLSKSILQCNQQFFHNNGVQIHQFKTKDSEIKLYLLCLGKISKNFTVDDMKKIVLKGFVYNISFSYETIDVTDIADIHKCLMKKHNFV